MNKLIYILVLMTEVVTGQKQQHLSNHLDLVG